MRIDQVKLVTAIMCTADRECEYCARNLVQSFVEILSEAEKKAAIKTFEDRFDKPLYGDDVA